MLLIMAILLSCMPAKQNWNYEKIERKIEKNIKKHLSSVTDSIPDFDSVGEDSNPSGGTD